MKKILTAIAVVFFFAITASFCNTKKQPAKPEQPVEEESIKEQPAEEQVVEEQVEYPYYTVTPEKCFDGIDLSLTKHIDKVNKEPAGNCYCHVKNGEHTQTDIHYLNDYGESVTLYLDGKDKIGDILIDTHEDNLLSRFQRYDCREPNNALICGNERVKERIDEYRKKCMWTSLVNGWIELAAKNPKDHLKIPSFDKSKLSTELRKWSNGDEDYCGEDFCTINIVLKGKTNIGKGITIRDQLIATYNRDKSSFAIGNVYLACENTLGEDVYLVLSEENNLLAFQYSLSPKYDCSDSKNKGPCDEAKTVLKFFHDNASWDEIVKQKIKEREEIDNSLNHI